MAYLEIKNILKKYGGKIVLNNISFDIFKGEIFAIAGPPGSGKTSLLKIIAGLLPPDEGKIYLEGRDITNTPPSARGIGMLFEIPPLYPDRTGFENIAFPLRLQKLPENEVRKRVYEVADLLGIKHLLDRTPGTYSGGEYQRAALARVLVRRPNILLLDEPLRNLDAKIQEIMRSWFKRLQRELGITMIYATHDPFEGMAVSDRMAILLNGVVKQLGKPFETYFNPKSLDVAEYVSIPAINILEGSVKLLDDTLNIRIDEISISKRIREKSIFMGKEKVLVGIRPEDIIVSKEPGAGKIEGKVSLIQVFGSDILLTIEIHGTAIRAMAEKASGIREGETIYLKFNEEKIYLFDPETKDAINV
ncbi:MAG: ABC transporter ATP-binding protein [Candidatus Bathyarchaeia archaeon]